MAAISTQPSSTSFTIIRHGRDLNRPSHSALAPGSELAKTRPLAELTEVEADQFIFELQAARRTSYVKTHPTLSTRRTAMLELADEVFGEAPADLLGYELTEEMERYYQDLLRILSRSLIGQGMGSDGEINYIPHSEAIDELAKSLQFVRRELTERMERMGRKLPIIPGWGIDGNLDRRLSEFDYELTITRFRRDVEGYLAFLYVHADVKSMHEADVGEVSRTKGKYRAEETHLLELPSMDENQINQLRKERRSGGIPPGIVSIFEKIPGAEEKEEDYEEGFRSAKKAQARMMAKKAADDPVLKGHGEPQRLSKAHRYSELLDPERTVPQLQYEPITSTPTHPTKRLQTLHPRLEAMIQEGASIEQATPVKLTSETPRLMSYDTGPSEFLLYPPRTTQEGSIPILELIPQTPASHISSQQTHGKEGGSRGSGRGPPQGRAPGGPSGDGGPSSGGSPRGGGWGLPSGPPAGGSSAGRGSPSQGPPNRHPGLGGGGGGPPGGGGGPPGGGGGSPGGGGGPPGGGGGPPGGGGGPPGGGGGPPGGGGGPPGGQYPFLPAPNRRPPSVAGPPLFDRYGLVIDDRYRFAPEHFDRKLKPETVSEWDGNTDNLPRWIRSVNRLSRRSDVIHRQLGEIAASRLTKKAKEWFDSLPLRHQDEATINWTTLRTAIATFFMNRTWLERQKLRANRAAFRESGHIYETPTDYFIRKTELLRLVYDLSEAETIMEVMDGAPSFWRQIIDTQRLESSIELQQALKYHESVLIHGFTDTNESEALKALERRLRTLGVPLSSSRNPPRNPRTFNTHNQPAEEETEARTNAVGWSSNLETPKWPKDDATRSKGKSPKDKGARPCRHCGSELHWDYECKYAKQGIKRARANFTSLTEEDSAAQEAYDDLYYDSDAEEGKPNDDSTVEASSHRVATNALEETLPISVTVRKGWAALERLRPSCLLESTEKPTRLERRKLREAVKASSRLAKIPVETNDSVTDGEPLILRRISSRPPGSTFLGSKATSTKALIGGTEGLVEEVIIDSGSDITLISHKFLSQLQPSPKIKTGQRVNLVQVTGAATISGFVEIPLVFDTNKGPVVLGVEAYVVKGMNAPFILGNDFADQYQLSMIREENGTHLYFGDSGRSVSVRNSVVPFSEGTKVNTFKITRKEGADQELSKRKTLRAEAKRRRKRNDKDSQPWVRTAREVMLPPLSITPVKVEVPTSRTERRARFMKGMLESFSNEEEAFCSPDCFLPEENPSIQVINLSVQPRTIPQGLIVGRLEEATRIPAKESTRARKGINKLATLVQTLLERTLTNEETQDDQTNEELVGPKIADYPSVDEIPTGKLMESLDVSPSLTNEQKQMIEEVVLRHAKAFGLDGRLGNFREGEYEINLRPGSKEISLAPYAASPVKREVIDKQLDAWLAMEVIEPSQSPWGFPVLIVYRNGKPRLCVDYRKLNEMTIPDAYALPRQEEILQALTGSQWLSTFDALAGFNQVNIRKSDWEKTAFRTHRGLFHFRRVPFGLMNGPSVFQRLMQNILSPYLWLFALVYIDDIVVYSRSFEEHVKHLEMLLARVAKAGVTLAPSKCHLGYQSLVLLGQKVSRLGMSTHREKIEAIEKLESPRNVHELQTFLGMMVYFSAYIPYYAWIVNPLFSLLKKGTPWSWGEQEEHAFSLAKEVLVSAPVRAFAIPGLGYRLYSDASDVGLACILQQVQQIKIKDLQGTKVYEKLRKAYQNQEQVPVLVQPLTTEEKDKWVGKNWEGEFEETKVDVERVIAYWSRTLKPAEKNYSPTEREALALKEGLVKFQAYLEGEDIIAITDHAALTWSKTFQNINRRLLSWGTTFAAYLKLKIVHRAGRVHSNVDPISRLKRRVPDQMGPSPNEEIEPSLILAGLDNEEEKSLPEIKDKMRDFADVDKGGKSIGKTRKPDRITEYDIPVTINGTEVNLKCTMANTYQLLVGLDASERKAFELEYNNDSHFREIDSALKNEKNWLAQEFPHYSRGEDGLIYFEDAEGNLRLCVPRAKINDVINDCHNDINEGAHGGYFKSYARIAACYYWPRMSRDIKRFVATCDVCQKIKPRQHSPYGILKPLPIPTKPFEVVTMDFIPELPTSDGFDSILVIVDKLTKYGHFIPTTTKVTDAETAKLFFSHIVSHYGLPSQLIMDRDTVWANSFWKELTTLMGIRRSLSTAHHPQTDGQTEILNQTLEIALRAYVNKENDDWSQKLGPLTLAYNSSVHSATNFSPAFLLRGFEPSTPARLALPTNNGIGRPTTKLQPKAENLEAAAFSEEFHGLRSLAMDSLLRAQIAQERNYNKGRLTREFEEGDLVLLNPNSLGLIKETRGRGAKLKQKYDGPFEITGKLSPVTYRLRLPASYKIHPIINIQHLESYETTDEFGTDRPVLEARRADFKELPEYEVESIVGDRLRRISGKRRVKQYKVRFVGYDASYDQWLTRNQLRNAPEILADWERSTVKEAQSAGRNERLLT